MLFSVMKYGTGFVLLILSICAASLTTGKGFDSITHDLVEPIVGAMCGGQPQCDRMQPADANMLALILFAFFNLLAVSLTANLLQLLHSAAKSWTPLLITLYASAAWFTLKSIAALYGAYTNSLFWLSVSTILLVPTVLCLLGSYLLAILAAKKIVGTVDD